MREFLLNSEEFLDKKAFEYLQTSGSEAGLFACSWVHFNERVKLAFFTEPLEPLSAKLEDMDLNDICEVGKTILSHVCKLQTVDEVSLENIVWDPDSIYVGEKGAVSMICLPANIPDETRHSDIYVKRLYALLEDLIAEKDGGDFVNRQINYQKNKSFGDWESLITTLGLREHDEDLDFGLTLRSINTPSPVTFQIRKENFVIGTDPGEADGLIRDVETIEPSHAKIGWNEINYYVTDLGSEYGTFVNDQRIDAFTEVPIGEGTVLRFAEYTFNVE